MTVCTCDLLNVLDGRCPACVARLGDFDRKVDPSRDLKITRGLREVIRGVMANDVSIQTHSPLRIQEGMTLVEIVDALNRSEDSLDRIVFLLAFALRELDHLTQRSEGLAKPTLADAAVVIASAHAALMKLNDIRDEIRIRGLETLVPDDKAEQFSADPVESSEARASVGRLFDELEAWRPLENVVAAARQSVSKLKLGNDAPKLHSTIRAAATRADWARQERERVAIQLDFWKDEIEDAHEAIVLEIIESMTSLSDVPELQQLTDPKRLAGIMPTLLKSIRGYLLSNTPDPEIIITRTLIGLGYPERKARSLWDADVKKARRSPT